MGVHILYDDSSNEYGQAALYSSTTGTAFGPVFADADDYAHDARERAEAFLRWLEDCEAWWTYERHPLCGDVRDLTDAGLERAYHDWLAQEAEQWQREAQAELSEDDLATEGS